MFLPININGYANYKSYLPPSSLRQNTDGNDNFLTVFTYVHAYSVLCCVQERHLIVSARVFHFPTDILKMAFIGNLIRKQIKAK